METKPTTDQEAAATPPPLKYQTYTLKVSIHSEGCNKKVKRLLQSLEGVYMTAIDSKQHKVTVTASVEPQTLIKKLASSGKHAELWPDHVHTNNADKSNAAAGNKPKTERTASQGGGGGGSRKKKKGQNGNNNPSPSNAPEPGPRVIEGPAVGPSEPDQKVVYHHHPRAYHGPLFVSCGKTYPGPNGCYFAHSMDLNEYRPSDLFDDSTEVAYDDSSDLDYDGYYDDDNGGCMIM